MAEAPKRFPFTEGLGIFLAVSAWDLLSRGQVNLLKASLIGVGGAVVWYGARCWWARRGGHPR